MVSPFSFPISPFSFIRLRSSAPQSPFPFLIFHFKKHMPLTSTFQNARLASRELLMLSTERVNNILMNVAAAIEQNIEKLLKWQFFDVFLQNSNKIPCFSTMQPQVAKFSSRIGRHFASNVLK
jgi:hypothetical protein